jgi:hypothetical protein
MKRIAPTKGTLLRFKRKNEGNDLLETFPELEKYANHRFTILDGDPDYPQVLLGLETGKPCHYRLRPLLWLIQPKNMPKFLQRMIETCRGYYHSRRQMKFTLLPQKVVILLTDWIEKQIGGPLEKKTLVLGTFLAMNTMCFEVIPPPDYPFLQAH